MYEITKIFISWLDKISKEYFAPNTKRGKKLLLFPFVGTLMVISLIFYLFIKPRDEEPTQQEINFEQ